MPQEYLRTIGFISGYSWSISFLKFGSEMSKLNILMTDLISDSSFGAFKINIANPLFTLSLKSLITILFYLIWSSDNLSSMLLRLHMLIIELYYLTSFDYSAYSFWETIFLITVKHQLKYFEWSAELMLNMHLKSGLHCQH